MVIGLIFASATAVPKLFELDSPIVSATLVTIASMTSATTSVSIEIGRSI